MIRLEQLRLDRGLTRVELAKLAGVSYEAVQRLEETGKAKRLDPLNKLAKALNVDPPSHLLAPAIFPTEEEAA